VSDLSNGHFNVTKKAFITAIETGLDNAGVTGYLVSGNWRLDMHSIVSNLPFVSVRFSPATLWDVYDRNVGETSRGSIADYNFSAHVFQSNCYESGEEKGKYAQDVSDIIISHLKSTTPVGWDTDRVTSRESEPSRGAHRISRVIVEGTIHIKRID